jgi:hypothetical protein
MSKKFAQIFEYFKVAVLFGAKGVDGGMRMG